jgi:hypothetical protein
MALLYREKKTGAADRSGRPLASTDLRRPAPGAHFGGFCCNTLHSIVEPTESQPLPLQAFWPLQALAADLQALWPLQAFTPLQSLFTIPEPLGLWIVCALAAIVPAANRAAALAMMIFFCIECSP